MNYDIVFTIMAVQEVVFFVPIAKRLMKEEDIKVVFFTFHEVGDDILKREGIPFFSLHKIKRKMSSERNLIGIKEIEGLLNIRINDLVIHEKLTANRQDEWLMNKVELYYCIFDEILTNNKIGCVVQELGGFLAPQLMYHLSRLHDVNHVFVEPAMFPKRVVFTLNDLYVKMPDYNNSAAAGGLDKEVDALVEQYIGKQTVVIPKKDKHFFQDMGFRRFFSFDNSLRLSRKLYHKYILGREEEYDAILWYAIYHLKKLFNRKSLNSYYSNPVAGEKYIYFPCHVPIDVQLTVRCPQFLDQESLVEKIAEATPEGYKLYVKEHPASIGGYSPGKLKRLLDLDKIRLIHPKTNSFSIIKNADCIVTINSKVGFEAIIQSKLVVVLGKTFYRGKGATVDVEDISALKDAIKDALNMKIDKDKRIKLLNSAFKWSYPGELYENSAKNVDTLYCSLRHFLMDDCNQNKECRELKKAAS